MSTAQSYTSNDEQHLAANDPPATGRDQFADLPYTDAEIDEIFDAWTHRPA